VTSDEAPLAVFLQDLAGGGAERVAVNLVNEFGERGVPTDLILVRDSGAYRDSVDPRIRIIRLESRKTLLSIPRLVRYLRTVRPAGLLSFQTHVNVAAVLAHALARVEIPMVVSEHVDPVRGAADHPAMLVRAAYRIAPRVYHNASAVAAVSEGVAREWRALTSLPETRVLRIYNPIYEPRILELAEQASGEPWLDDPDVPVIVAAGRLEEQKDVPMLLRAFALTLRARKCRLVVLGEGQEEARLRALSRELGIESSLKFVGFRPNPYAFYARAHVFALSSSFEGFGNVLVEALACGAHIVSTDCPHGPREILEDGRWGRLVAVGDAHAFSGALTEALDTPRPGAGQVRRAEAFSIRSAADEYMRLLRPETNHA
jgi:glycosyltransferase involved in cell wall biosynthesis